MRTFLCAICILLLMLGAILLITFRIQDHVGAMLTQLTALESASEAECVATTEALDTLWRRAKPIVGLAVNGRITGEIDRLIASMQTTASHEHFGAHRIDWERDRGLLIAALEEITRLLRCGIWEII